MTAGALAEVEAVLADGSSADAVLDVVDDAIEEATRLADAAALAELADLLDATAAERGGDWQRLTIAAMRARAVAGVPPAPASAPPVTPVAPVVRYAGWWIRTAAFLLDWLLVLMVYGLLSEIAWDDASLGLALVVWVGVPLAYFAGMHALNKGATAGKAVFGIAVRDADGGLIGLGRAIGRAAVSTILWVTLLGALIDALVLGVDRRKQSLHDKAAWTVVVRTRGGPPARI